MKNSKLKAMISSVNLKHKLQLMQRFINKFKHKVWLGLNGFVKGRQLPRKIWELTQYLVNVAFTGIIIHYSITHFNWLSVGIIAALAQYYIDWFIKTVKQDGNTGN